jgi:excinuclease ABC subunit B
MGRAARHISGTVILYTDRQTPAIRDAVAEVVRRRKIQEEYNRLHNIVPRSIEKPIRRPLVEADKQKSLSTYEIADINTDYIAALTPLDRKHMVADLQRQMVRASRNLQFEIAAQIRDIINSLTE